MRIRGIVAGVLVLLLGGSAVPARAADGLGPLVDVAARRLDVADLVAAAKWGTGKPIEDKAREQQILDAVAERSAAMGVDPATAQRIFRDQIEAGKLVQRGLFARWALRPGDVPAHRPDLEKEVRPLLDRITGELLAGIKDTRDVRRSPSCRTELAKAVGRVEGARHPDALHRIALTRAIPSIC
ncbi:chorismate mutase [Actinomadura montaniterrae]|uniref:Chorismate mutase n=1 Tax=Actinomadura montaniterrae TaxID=1803903 RepID=A0A6L3VPY6_9ACTN|nr:chorismate mutase [Actinomadura montaniterrae]KAB2378209.1 chorismate mutase [Actinomadura montaniterrae]